MAASKTKERDRRTRAKKYPDHRFVELWSKQHERPFATRILSHSIKRKSETNFEDSRRPAILWSGNRSFPWTAEHHLGICLAFPFKKWDKMPFPANVAACRIEPFSTSGAPTCSSAAIRATRCRPSPRSESARSARNQEGRPRAGSVAAACDPRPSSTASHSNRRAR
jgi:hypothetical protein